MQNRFISSKIKMKIYSITDNDRGIPIIVENSKFGPMHFSVSVKCLKHFIEGDYMTASQKIVDFLEENSIDYELLEHPAAYTAQEIAGKQHIPGRLVIKSVIAKLDGKLIMCVLPAIHLVDFDTLKNITGALDVRLATEEEISETFPDYEVGAEPPFGHLYDLDVFVDKFLEQENEVVFNAGTHTDMIKIKRADFMQLAKPTIADFGVHI